MSARSSATSPVVKPRPVVAALDLARHLGVVDRARLRSSLIDHGSHGERSSGGTPGVLRARVQSRPHPVQDVDAVHLEGADDRVHPCREEVVSQDVV